MEILMELFRDTTSDLCWKVGVHFIAKCPTTLPRAFSFKNPYTSKMKVDMLS
jgi:hypothetical protein